MLGFYRWNPPTCSMTPKTVKSYARPITAKDQFSSGKRSLLCLIRLLQGHYSTHMRSFSVFHKDKLFPLTTLIENLSYNRLMDNHHSHNPAKIIMYSTQSCSDCLRAKA